jgi:serine/threonine protein kinase
VLPFAAGGNLRRLIERFPSGCPAGCCRRVFAQIASAFRYVHGHLLVHCDLKPENILMVRADDFHPDIWLADFWPCKTFRQAAQNTSCVGTTGYIAQEVQEGRQCLPRF